MPETKGNPLMHLIKLVMKVTSAITTSAKIAISVAISDTSRHGTDQLTDAIQAKFNTVTLAVKQAGDNILALTAPGGDFAMSQTSTTSLAGSTNLVFNILAPDDTRLILEMDVSTAGYQPDTDQLTTLVIETIDPVLDVIGEQFGSHLNIDGIDFWKADALQGIYADHGIDAPSRELAGASA